MDLRSKAFETSPSKLDVRISQNVVSSGDKLVGSENQFLISLCTSRTSVARAPPLQQHCRCHSLHGLWANGQGNTIGLHLEGTSSSLASATMLCAWSSISASSTCSFEVKAMETLIQTRAWTLRPLYKHLSTLRNNFKASEMTESNHFKEV